MGQHFPDDMARKRQERRQADRAWRADVGDDLRASGEPFTVRIPEFGSPGKRVAVTAQWYEPEPLDVNPTDLPEGWTTVEALKGQSLREPSEAEIERVSRLIGEQYGEDQRS